MNADEGAPNVEEMPPRDSEQMRIIQSKQTVCPDSLNMRDVGPLNGDLVGNQVYSGDNKEDIMVDFGEENKDA